MTAKFRELSEAEKLLQQIGGARLAFSCDPGGPVDMVAGMVIIERWIRAYFDDHPLTPVITVPLKDGGTMDVNATVFGEWAAHPKITDDGLSVSQSSVTHVPTGRCLNIGKILDQEDAESVARALARDIPGSFSGISSDGTITPGMGDKIKATVRSVLWPAEVVK